MKHLLIMTWFLLGCAQGSMAVVREGADIRFNFGSPQEPALVLGISVFEMDGGNRGRTICSLERSSKYVLPAETGTWTYGKPLPQSGFYPAGCGPLTIGREYGVAITDASHRNFYKRFRLAEDGRILTIDR